ncbi:hypothetical protein B0H14DRAFT_3729298, partial [Mycena olivaceomarginata]
RSTKASINERQTGEESHVTLPRGFIPPHILLRYPRMSIAVIRAYPRASQRATEYRQILTHPLAQEAQNPPSRPEFFPSILLTKSRQPRPEPVQAKAKAKGAAAKANAKEAAALERACAEYEKALFQIRDSFGFVVEPGKQLQYMRIISDGKR